MKKNEVLAKTSRATKWSSITEIMSKLVTPISSMILARLLTPEAFGVVATVNMITSFAEVFTDAGFQKYIVQRDFKDKKELDENTTVAFWSNVFIAALIFIIICIFNDELAELVGNPGLGSVVIVASLSLIINSFSSIQMARFKRDFDFKTLFYIRIVTCLIPLVVTVPIAFATHSYWALITGTLVSNAANAVILTAKSSWKPKFYYSFQQFFEMFSYSWWILLESISLWLTSYIGTFIVGRYLSTYYVGMYKTSMTTVNQIMSLITAATSMPLFSALSRLKNDKEEMDDVYCSYMQAISVLVIPLGAGMWLYRDLVTTILLGNQWMEANNFIGLLGAINSLVLVFGSYCNGLYNAIGKTKLSLLTQILQLIVLVPVLLIYAPLGFEKLYVARSLARLELIAVQIIIMGIVIRFPLKKMVLKSIPSFVCTAIMIIVNIPLMNVLNSVYSQIFGVIISITVYFLMMRLLFNNVLINTLKTFGVNPNGRKKLVN